MLRTIGQRDRLCSHGARGSQTACHIRSRVNMGSGPEGARLRFAGSRSPPPSDADQKGGMPSIESHGCYSGAKTPRFEH